MKAVKIVSVILISTMLMSLITGCGSNRDTEQPEQSTTTERIQDTESVEETDRKDTESAEDPDTQDSASDQVQPSGSRILIAYFTAGENSEVDVVSSASVTMVDGEAKGRLRVVADMIQAETGGDLFSIQTSVEYPGDGGELIDYAAEEQAEDVRPELTSHIEDLDAYDTIFVGYPNWWADLPMVMYSFFDEYDFSGKTIIPFNVHNGSRFSSTIQTIQELEPDAEVIIDGFTVSEKSVADAADDVAEWLDGLGY